MGALKIKPVLRPNKKTLQGKIPVYYRFTKNRKTNYQASGIECYESEWNFIDNRLWEKKPSMTDLKKKLNSLSENQLFEIVANAKVNPLAKDYNAEINAKLSAFENKKTELSFLNKGITSSTFKKEIQKSQLGESDESFIKYWKKRIEHFEDSESTSARAYSDTLNIFEKFTGTKDIKFSDIDVDFVNDLNAYLKRQKSKTGGYWSEDYIYKIVKSARATYNQAIKDGVYETDRNPFAGRVKRPNSSKNKEHLNKEEINQLIELKLGKGSFQWHVRNAFIFALCNGGVRISDILLLRWENIKSNNRIEYSMKKTKDESALPLNELSLNILKSYEENRSSRNFVFPFMSGSENETNFKILEKKLDSKKTYINKTLKQIATLAKIEKNITTHIARHSYAGFTIEAGNNPAITKRILKHKEQKTTDRYIGNLSNKLIDEAHLKTLDGIRTAIL